MVMDDSDLYRHARDRMDAGDLAGAIDLFAASVAASPHFKALELWGECLLRLGRPRDAVVPLAAATALNRQPRAPALLGQAFLALNQYSRAVEFADEALARAPGNRTALDVRRAALPHLVPEA